MDFPLGMLIFWAHRYDDEFAVISGLWYYKEIHVPCTVVEKKSAVADLKNNRCIAINITGSYDQILDILMQTDKFFKEGVFDASAFNSLKNNMINSDDKAVIFDDIHNLAGTALTLDTLIKVEETMEEIQASLKSWRTVNVKLSSDWSFSDELRSFLSHE